MSNRRFEMYQYRQVICRMRLGETDRRIAKAGLMGRRKAAELREIARVFNAMMEKIERHKDALESEVAIRTLALKEARDAALSAARRARRSGHRSHRRCRRLLRDRHTAGAQARPGPSLPRIARGGRPLHGHTRYTTLWHRCSTALAVGHPLFCRGVRGLGGVVCPKSG